MCGHYGRMVYDIEFIRRVDGKAEELALDVIRVVGDTLASVVTRAEELFSALDTVPRPSGFRIREAGSCCTRSTRNLHSAGDRSGNKSADQGRWRN